MEFSQIGKLLIFAGLVLFIAGILFILLPKLIPFGKLPGDILIRKKNFTFYFPIVTSILLSIVLTILLNLLRSGK